MVTNLEEKNKKQCCQYWPDTGTKSYGPFKVTITGQQILTDDITRKFSVQVYKNIETIPIKNCITLSIADW